MFSLESPSVSCQHLPDFPTYHHVTELNLSNHQLTRIDYFPFEHFPNLRTLDLSYNQLTFINPDWSKTFENRIENLNLHQNNLQTLLFLKDFKYLKTLTITGNLLEPNEQVLALDICPTIEHLIDHDQDQIENERMEKSNEDFQNLTNDFTRTMKIEDELKYPFRPIKFLRAHHQSHDDLINTSVHMCAFQPNTSHPILATCGGTKACLIDCHTCEITHLFEVSTLRASTTSTNRKFKQKINAKEYFSCLCWMEIDGLQILAIGATNGHIYLLSPSNNLMFGHIELSNSSISCLTWHVSDPLTLIIGSYHTVRFINIQSYIDRLRAFLRKRTQPAVLFDYVDSSMFVHKVSTTHLYNLYGGDGPLITITDLLFHQSTLLVGTTSGLFVIRKGDQSPMQLPLPKSIWTVSTHIESLRSINSSISLIAMSILHADQIYCFDVEQSLQKQQLYIRFTLPNPARQIPTKIALFSKDNISETFECLVGNNNGLLSYHQMTPSSQKQLEIPWLPMDSSACPPSILSASLNDQYLCLTTDNNLICIYQRQ